MALMRRYGKTSFLLSLVIALFLVLACGSAKTPLISYNEASSKWGAIVDEHISDAQRADRLKQYGRQLDHLQTSLAADIETVTEKLSALNVDYGSTKDDMQQALSVFTEKRNKALKEYRDIIFSMCQEVSAEEWQALLELNAVPRFSIARFPPLS